eukprot:GHUV01040887.1.p1 GENE.GHUV01040887.1~~GHUV01040887.1.p1  ORF type:complete len:142 (+),score=38.38 GHUV01040887.1:1145-1570(+)
MAFDHYNKPAAATHSSKDTTSSSSGFGAALFCCQAVMSLRRLAADLSAGMKCCQALDEGITAALQEASRVVSGSISGVPKDVVFPLFESAGRLNLALTGKNAFLSSIPNTCHHAKPPCSAADLVLTLVSPQGPHCQAKICR